MTTDRRKFLQGLIISVGGASMLAACEKEPVVEVTELEKVEPRFYSQDELATLTRFSDLLIPRTETAGAIDVKVPEFMDGLMAEWASVDTQSAQRATLLALKTELDLRAGGDFASAEESVAVEALTALDADAFKNGKLIPGYRGFKGLVAEVYFNSDEGANDEWGYQPVPGYWDPSVDVSSL